MNKITSIILAVIIIGGTWYFVLYDSKSNTNGNPAQTSLENTEIKNGVQYITITAKGGYSPRQSFAKAGIPTKLVMKTNGTYDCSAALVIRSLNYREMLPNTAETIIDAGIPKVGDVLQGVCGMGMYSFVIQFK